MTLTQPKSLESIFKPQRYVLQKPSGMSAKVISSPLSPQEKDNRGTTKNSFIISRKGKKKHASSNHDLTAAFLKSIEPMHTKLSQFQSFANLQQNFKMSSQIKNESFTKPYDGTSLPHGTLTARNPNKDQHCPVQVLIESENNQNFISQQTPHQGTNNGNKLAPINPRELSSFSDFSASHRHSNFNNINNNNNKRRSTHSFESVSEPVAKTVYLFFQKQLAHAKTGEITEYKFSYDRDHYYFERLRLASGDKHILALPVSEQSVRLIDEYSSNLEALIHRLKLNKSTG